MNKNIGIAAVFLTLGLLAAIGVRVLLNDKPVPVPRTDVAPATAPQPVATSTSAALQQEIAAREQLAITVARLEKELNDLKTRVTAPSATAATEKAKAPQQAAAPDEKPSNDDSDALDEQTLRDAGLNVGQVTQIRESYEQLEMDRLYLRDRATREGWMGTVRFSNEVAKLEESRQEIRSSLGDEGYDAYLFATGQSNRVMIREMLGGSPAKQAGLQANDRVLRYGDKRVFTTRELQNATTGGRNGEMVRVEIERDGKRMDIYVPRGPMGVYLDNDSVKP